MFTWYPKSGTSWHTIAAMRLPSPSPPTPTVLRLTAPKTEERTAIITWGSVLLLLPGNLFLVGRDKPWPPCVPLRCLRPPPPSSRSPHLLTKPQPISEEYLINNVLYLVTHYRCYLTTCAVSSHSNNTLITGTC